MSDDQSGQSQFVPRPVDAAIAANWRAFFAGGGVFSLPPATEVNRRKRRNNTVFLALIALVAGAVISVAAVLFSTGDGWALTYVLLAVLLIVTIAAGVRIASIRRALNAVRDSPQEYLAVSRDGMRFAGVDLPWPAIVGGLIIDERSVEYSGLKRLTARVMAAAGHSKEEMLLGTHAGTVRDYRAQAPGAVRRTFFVSMGSGGPRIALQHPIDADSIDALTTATRVSAADADVPIIVSRNTAIIHRTIMAIWRGKAAQGSELRRGGPVSSRSEEDVEGKAVLEEHRSVMTVDALAAVVLSEEGRRVRDEAASHLSGAGVAAFRERYPDIDDGFHGDGPRDIDLLVGAGQHPYPVSIGWCDASGEGDPGQIRWFVAEACRQLALPAPEWDVDSALDDDGPAALLRDADRGLAAVGLRLLMIDLDSDTYLFTPVTEDDLHRLNGKTGEGFGLHDVDGMLRPSGASFADCPPPPTGR